MTQSAFEFLSPEHIRDMATSMAVAGAIAVALHAVVHFVFYFTVLPEVRTQKIFLAPAILVGLSIFSLSFIPAILILYTSNPQSHLMNLWGLAMISPMCALTYPLMWAMAWLSPTITHKYLKWVGLTVSFGVSMYLVAPFLLLNAKDALKIVQGRFF